MPKDGGTMICSGKADGGLNGEAVYLSKTKLKGL